MTEVWKDIPGYEGKYQASDEGNIRSVAKRLRFVSKKGNESWRQTQPKIIAQQTINSGYNIVHLHSDNLRRAVTVHALVAGSFLGPRPEGLDVNHKNANKTDNRLANLEYVTRTKNHEHAVRMGLNALARAVVGTDVSGNAETYPSITNAAKAHGVTFGSIKYAILKGSVCAGKKWGVA